MTDFYLAREGDANPGVPKQYIFETETCLLKNTFLKESWFNVAPITEEPMFLELLKAGSHYETKAGIQLWILQPCLLSLVLQVLYCLGCNSKLMVL